MFINSEESLNLIISNKFDALENSDKKVKDVLPEGFENILKVYIYNNKDGILKFIKSFTEKQDFKANIRKEVSKLLEGVNPALRKFINLDNLCNNIFDGIDKYIENPENSMKVLELIYKAMDIIKEKSLRDILPYIPYEGKKTIINFISNNIYKILN
ncbi:hypothetical protein GCM10008905_06650 [Clostridium malenominatum]|uniref:Uncharacterized protein n=1 Tax=Clostridium malenominatum TaxID=1539 RepID=A0ABN1IQL9_9CLOT